MTAANSQPTIGTSPLLSSPLLSSPLLSSPLLSSPLLSDEVKTTTCYMCACRCGIKVHLKNGKIRYIEGNPDHPVNKGILCGKGSAGNTIRATAS